MQHGFGASDGWWGRGGVDLSGIQATIAPIVHVLDRARRVGIPVIYLTMDLAHAGSYMDERMARWFAAVGTPPADDSRRRDDERDSEIIPELAPQHGECVVVKPKHSGFFQTDLDAILKERGISTLVFTGCTTSVCVESTLRDAYFRNYRCLLLTDCTAEPVGNGFSRTNYEATLLLVELAFGWTSDSEQLLRALSDAAGRQVHVAAGSSTKP
jgi:ureidoacrylate peracid hydrolase